MEPSIVTAREIRYKPNTVLTNHVHKNPYFCVILRGGYAGRYGSKFQEGHPAETVFRPAGETHSVHFHNLETRVLVIEFSRDLLKLASQHCCGLDVSSSFVSGGLTWLAKRLWAEQRLGDPCSQLAIEGLLLEMLAEVSRQPCPSVERVPEWLLRIKGHIKDTFGQAVSIKALARIANVHPVYLVTAFKKAFRSTPGEYQRMVRIRKAEELILKMPTMPLSEIALATGFFDQSHFSRVFKQVTTVTPGEFRQSHLKS